MLFLTKEYAVYKILSVLLFWVLSAPAFALGIPLSSNMVNDQVQKAFPKEIKKVHLTQPKVQLEKSRALLCMKVQVKVSLVQSAPFDTCSSFSVHWNVALKRAEAKEITLQEVRTESGGALPGWVLKLLSTQVLPMVEPLVLYEGSGLIPSAIESLAVKDGQLWIEF